MMKNKMGQRMLSMVLALLMVMSAGTAFASAKLTPADLFAKGAAVEYEFGVQLDVPTVSSLFSMFGGVSDEGTMTLVKTVVSALNKLTVKALVNQNLLSAVIGTENGPIIDFQAKVDMETMENALTVSVAPDLIVSVDPAVIKELLGQMPKLEMTPEQAQLMIKPYGDALNKFWTEQFVPTMQTEQGSFAIPELALNFTQKQAFTVSSHQVADLMAAMLQVMQNDPSLLKMIQQVQSTSGQGAGDPMAELAKGVAEMKAKENTVGLNGTLYTDEAGSTYVELTNAKDLTEPGRLTLLIRDTETGYLVNTLFLLKAKSADGTVPQVDWAALKEEIKGGKNYTDTMFSFDYDATVDKVNGQYAATGLAGLTSKGTTLSLTIDTQLSMVTLDSKFSLGLAFMSPTPIVTLHFATRESTVQPLAPDAADKTPVVITGNKIPDELAAQVMGSVMTKGLPALLEKMVTALPEEGPMLKMIIQAMLAPKPTESTGVEVTAEPVVEVTAEPVVEVTAEPVVEVTAEPVVEVTAEPVVEVTAEPVVEATPTPVVGG